MELAVVGCAGGVGRAGEACSGYLLREGPTRVLLDCGAGVASKLQRVCPLEELDDVVVSHWHPDHASDAGVLVHGRIIQRLLGQTERTLRFYAPASSPDLERVGRAEDGCASQAVHPGQRLAIGDLDIEFLRTRHPVECLAMRVASRLSGATLAYTADGALTCELAEFCRGADVLLAECSLYPGVSGEGPGHMNADDVARLAELARPGMLVLTHLPFYGRREDLLEHVAQRWGGEVALAREGMRLAPGPHTPPGVPAGPAAGEADKGAPGAAACEGGR